MRKKERGGRGGDESRGEEIGEMRGWKERRGEAEKRRRGRMVGNKVVILQVRPILDFWTFGQRRRSVVTTHRNMGSFSQVHGLQPPESKKQSTA
jgi:hypothetical protein